MATVKNYTASDLFTLANRIRKANGVSQKEAFAMAKAQLENRSTEDTAAVLYNMMNAKNVKFTFKNAKGKEITTTGTVRMDKVPTNRKVEGKKNQRTAYDEWRHKVNNYFRTKEGAEDAINLVKDVLNKFYGK